MDIAAACQKELGQGMAIDKSDLTQIKE